MIVTGVGISRDTEDAVNQAEAAVNAKINKLLVPVGSGLNCLRPSAWLIQMFNTDLIVNNGITHFVITAEVELCVI